MVGKYRSKPVKKRIEMLKLLEGFLKRKIIFEYKLHE
jgi:hypothetical protein